MKNERKPKTPIFAAYSAHKNGDNPAPPNKSNNKKARGSSSSKIADPLDVASLPEQNPNPIMRFSRDGEALYTNLAAAALLPFSVEKPAPEDWRDLIRSTYEADSSTEVEIQYEDKVYSALFVPVSEAGYVNIYCHEVTEQKRMQDDLYKSEERFRQAADASGALVYEVDVISGATAIVHGMERLTGYDPREITPSSEWWHSLIHPDDLPAHLAQLDELLKSGGADVCEYRLHHKNGNWINVHDSRLAFKNEAGQTVRLIGTLIDITKHKQVEEMLRVQESELQDIIDQTPFMLTRCTRDLHYRFVSQAYAQMIGRKPQEVAGKPILEIMGEQGWKAISPFVEKVLQGERVEYESRVSFQGIGVRDLHVIYSPDIDGQGNVIGWFASISDVTERIAAEQERIQLLQREQKQRANAEQAQRVAEQATAKAEHELSERKLAEQALGVWADAPLPQEARPIWLRYGMALVVIGIAILVRDLLDPLLGDTTQYSLLIGAVAFSVWYGGVGPALFSLLVGYVGITWLVLDWQHVLVPTPTMITSLLIFLFSGLIVVSLGETMRRAQRDAHWSARVAVKSQREAEFRIQEQQRAESALRESEQRFREIFETAGVSVWVEDFTEVKAAIEELHSQGVKDFRSYFNSNPDFVRRAIDMVRILDVNQETLDLYGTSTKDELLGSLHTTFLPETENAFLEELVTLAEGKDVIRSETQMRALDGRTISVLFTVHFNSLTGDYSRVIVTLTDITERKKIEQDLARERELFKRLFETMPVMSSIYDPQTNSLRMNAKLEQLTGWKAEEVTVVSLLEALYPDPEYMKEVLGRMAAAVGTNEWVEVRMQTRDGRTLDTLWANISIMDGEKIITGISLGIDITERKRMEDAIRESEERYRAIVSQATAGIAESNLDNGLIFVNPRFCEMLGYSESELLGKTIWELTYTEDVEQNRRLFQRMLEDGEAYQFEKRFIRKDGSYLWTNVSVSPIHDLSGRPRGGVGVIIDIEKRKRAEQAIIDYARQQAALFTLAERLQHSYVPDEIYNAALDVILDALQCDRASILLFDHTERMKFVAWRGLSETYRQATKGHSPWKPYDKDIQPIYYNDVDASELSDELKIVIKDEGIGSLAFIPLVPNGKLIGKFMVYFDAPHTFSETEIDLSLTIARQLAFDIARKRAEEQLRWTSEYDAFRVTLADTLRLLKDPAEIQAAAMRILGEHLQVDGAFYSEVNEAEQIAVIADNYVRDSVSKLVGHFHLRDYGKASEILRAGGKLILSDVAAYPDLGDADQAPFAALGIRSAMAVPIIKDGRWVAALGVYHGTPRTWSAQEIALLEATAEHTWAVLERARSQEALRASEALYRTIARSIPGGGVYVVDRDMRYLVAEGPVTEAFGLSREMLEGRTVSEVFPDERGARMEARLQRNFAGEIVDFETSFNGRVFWTQQAPVYDSIGQAIIVTVDITERKRAEEALRSSEERMRLAIESHRMVAWEWDAIADSVTTSANFQEVYGLTEVSSIADGFALIWPEDLPAHKEKVDQVMRTGGEYHSEFRITRPADGRVLWMEERATALTDAAGKVTRLMGIVIDVTERKQAEEKLRESEQRFAGFMQHLPGLAWIKDTQGRYVFANDAAEKAFRVPRAELYGRTDVDIFPPNVAEQFRRNDEQTLHEAKGIQVVEGLEHADGVLHYSLVNKFPILGSDGATTLIGGMAIDITESKQAEARLTLLSEISELARDSENAEELMSAVADAVGKHLHVKRCLFNEIDVENDIEVVHHDYHDGVDSVAGVHRVTDYSSITSVEMMKGITVVNHDSKTDPRTAQDYEQSYVPNGERAYVAVPLMRDNRWAASLWVSDDKPRRWTDEDVALLQTIAERTWTACEKIRIHRELRDSEERLRVTFNTTAVGFAMLTPDTHFVDVNQAFCDIVGYSREELLTLNFDYLTHPDYVKSTRDHVRRLLRGKVPFSVIEKLYIRKDGSQVWVQNHMSLVSDVDGDPLHLIIISQDISERKQIETLQLNATQSLLFAAEANAKFRTFFDQGSYFAGVMTLDGTLVEANRLCLDFCGFTREDVIGKKFWDCGWWSPSPALMEMVRKGTQEAAEGKTFRQESTYYMADGSVRFVDLIIAPIKDEDGRILFLAPTGTDITDRKQAEEELRQLNLLLEERVEKRTLQLETSDQLRRLEMFERRQAQDRFAKSFDASPAAMTITRFEDGLYRNVNPKFIELLGYELDEVIGRTTLDLKFYKDPGERAQLLNFIRNNNSKWEYETKLETKDGRLLDVDISVVEIELEGEPHILSMIMDITERNRILAALRASEQQLRTLFDVLPVGISYVAQDGKVIESNRTLEKILDITREGIQSGLHRTRQYIRPDGTPMPASEFASTRAFTEQRTVNNVETGIIKDGGQVIWTSVSATPISMPEPGVVVITVDVTERKHMDDELRRSHRRYQILSRRLVEIQEEERRTISRELHDRVGQSLAALNLNLNFLNSSLSGTTSLPIKSRLKDAIQLTEETVSTIRDVMADLRPPALDDYGLEAALNAYVDPFSRRFGIRVVLVKPVNPIPRMNPNIELTLLRIAQEALTNVARHANAKQATVTLLCQNDMVHLTIEDNGEGIRSWQKANRPGSHGLKIMRERAETFGGTLQVQSFSKKGTKIEVKIPIQRNDPTRNNGETN